MSFENIIERKRDAARALRHMGIIINSFFLFFHFISSYSDSISPDLPTLLGVSTGIFVLAGLICMVLHLFSKTKYPRARSFADAHHSGPPVFFASDTGILYKIYYITSC